MNIVSTPLESVPPYSILAEDVYVNFTLISPSGSILTPTLLSNIKKYQLESLNIWVDEKKDSSPPPAALTRKTQLEQMKQSSDFKEFKQNYTSTLSSFQQNMYALVNDPSHQQEVINSIVEESLHYSELHTSEEYNALDMIICMKEFDDSTFSHSLNVSLICEAFGSWLNMSKENIELLRLAGLLHDIGKLTIDKDIITKPGKLLDHEFNEIKKHPLAGYQILKNTDLDVRIHYAALQHHEKIDGSGYPFGIKEKQIHYISKIVSIVDVYEAMTATRCYRKPMCPFKVLQIMRHDATTKYDLNLIATFFSGITSTYINKSVELSDGSKGVVKYTAKSEFDKPTIVCFNGKIIHMKEHPELYIKELI